MWIYTALPPHVFLAWAQRQLPNTITTNIATSLYFLLIFLSSFLSVGGLKYYGILNKKQNKRESQIFLWPMET
jgi:hypothetical protein